MGETINIFGLPSAIRFFNTSIWSCVDKNNIIEFSEFFNGLDIIILPLLMR